MSDRKYLFASSDLSQVLESHKRRLLAVIEEFNPDELLATSPDDLTERLVEEFHDDGEPTQDDTDAVIALLRGQADCPQAEADRKWGIKKSGLFPAFVGTSISRTARDL